jgi:hypothetical protein
MAKIRRNRRKGSERLLSNVKAQRGLDRKAHFTNGGSLVEWRGGPRTVERNQKRYRRPRPGQDIHQ